DVRRVLPGRGRSARAAAGERPGPRDREGIRARARRAHRGPAQVRPWRSFQSHASVWQLFAPAMTRPIAAIVCAVALSGCANLWQNMVGSDTAARDERESRQVVELIGYAQRVAALEGDAQQRELNASSQMFSKDRGAYGRVRLALVMSLPGTAFCDETKAAGLLEPLVTKEAGGPMQQFAGLLHTQLSERMREQRRAAQLKEQLDALKDVERKIIER